ncbi:hypothetical protein IW136_000258 [Coemansia sp. RSA 678]|nr:hypothetical protein IW136_000258 [Coemansia sp. RSA 678]
MDSPGSSLSNHGTTPPSPSGAHSQLNAPDLPAGFGDAEFCGRYKTYRQQRRLSTQPVNWVKQFVEMHGLESLSEYLGFLSHADMRKEDDITNEIEIIKCI